MTNDVADVCVADLGDLPPAEVEDLGDSVLGHAVRRVMEAGGRDGRLGACSPVAAFQDCI